MRSPSNCPRSHRRPASLDHLTGPQRYRIPAGPNRYSPARVRPAVQSDSEARHSVRKCICCLTAYSVRYGLQMAKADSDSGHRRQPPDRSGATPTKHDAARVKVQRRGRFSTSPGKCHRLETAAFEYSVLMVNSGDKLISNSRAVCPQCVQPFQIDRHAGKLHLATAAMYLPRTNARGKSIPGAMTGSNRCRASTSDRQ